MKYLKLLLIPIITLMFFIPVKADDIDIPYDNVFTDKDYIVATMGNNIYRVYWDKGTAPVRVFYYGNVDKNIIISPEIDNTFAVNTSLKAQTLNNGIWETKTITRSGSQYVINNVGSGTFKIHYSSVSIRYPDFQPAPVLTLAQFREKVTGATIMEMGDKVKVTSGTISAVGGVILGLVLVPVLISRLRYWVRV